MADDLASRSQQLQAAHEEARQRLAELRRREQEHGTAGHAALVDADFATAEQHTADAAALQPLIATAEATEAALAKAVREVAEQHQREIHQNRYDQLSDAIEATRGEIEQALERLAGARRTEVAAVRQGLGLEEALIRLYSERHAVAGALGEEPSRVYAPQPLTAWLQERSYGDELVRTARMSGGPDV